MSDPQTTNKKMLIMCAPDIRFSDPLKLGIKVRDALLAGMDVDVRLSDGKKYGLTATQIIMDDPHAPT